MVVWKYYTQRLMKAPSLEIVSLWQKFIEKLVFLRIYKKMWSNVNWNQRYMWGSNLIYFKNTKKNNKEQKIQKK